MGILHREDPAGQQICAHLSLREADGHKSMPTKCRPRPNALGDVHHVDTNLQRAAIPTIEKEHAAILARAANCRRHGRGNNAEQDNPCCDSGSGHRHL